MPRPLCRGLPPAWSEVRSQGSTLATNGGPARRRQTPRIRRSNYSTRDPCAIACESCESEGPTPRCRSRLCPLPPLRHVQSSRDPKGHQISPNLAQRLSITSCHHHRTCARHPRHSRVDVLAGSTVGSHPPFRRELSQRASLTVSWLPGPTSDPTLTCTQLRESRQGELRSEHPTELCGQARRIQTAFARSRGICPSKLFSWRRR